MSSDFDPLFRGRVYCNGQTTNSKAFDENIDKIKWDKESTLEEIEERGNHSGSLVKHFRVRE